MQWILWIVGAIGHLGIWCVAFNQIHATSWPRSSRKVSEKIILLLVALPLIWWALSQFAGTAAGHSLPDNGTMTSERGWGWEFVELVYGSICIPLGLFFVLQWAYRKLTFRLPPSVIANQQKKYYPQREIGSQLLHGWFARTLGHLPLNEILQLTTQNMTFSINVAAELDGLKICQLSDLHFTGQIGIEYFEDVVQRANDFQPDLILITGDLVDEARCLPWLAATLGKLRAALGCYYVLGNHDLRIADEGSYRRQLEELGLIRAAGIWHSILFNGAELKITGNELPWYEGAESLPRDDDQRGLQLRILLSHSPDQIDWARPYEFDLMFAGHTHGGQIAFPLIGAVVAPSRYGVKYAAGTFQIGATLMHVSRGISGDEPIRFGSPPELGFFTIRSTRIEARSLTGG